MGGWMNKYRQIREKLYDIMVAASAFEEGGDSNNISQNMGIAMTAAVRKGGVVNVISQSIAIQKIYPKIVDLLKYADQLEQDEPVINVKQIEYIEDPVEKCCEFFYDRDTAWKEFKETMRTRYMDYVRRQSKTNTEAARFLKVHNSYVTKHIKMGDDSEDSRPDV